MTSVGVSRLARTSVFFVELGVKTNGQYYRSELLALMLGVTTSFSKMGQSLIVQKQH